MPPFVYVIGGLTGLYIIWTWVTYQKNSDSTELFVKMLLFVFGTVIMFKMIIDGLVLAFA